jgi:DNA-directed RNA polymerase specialized sigma24 family protein
MNKIVENYLTRNYYQLLTIAKKMTKNHDLHQDLLHEVIIQLYDKDRIKLKSFDDDSIRYYIVAIMRINWFSQTSPFHYRVRREIQKYTEMSEILNMEEPQESFEKQLIFDILEIEYAELTWFHKSLMDMYLTLGSLKKVSKQTTIPLSSIATYIKEAKLQIKTNITNKLKD